MALLAFLFARPLNFQRVAHWLALGGFVGLVVALNIAIDERNDARDALKSEQSAHALTRANYRAAAAMARNMAQERADKVERAAANISEEIKHGFEARIADARARARARVDRLREDAAAPGAGGNTGSPDLPSVPDPARRADAAACEAGLPAADALIATEQAIQIDALIDWLEAQQRTFRQEQDQ